MNALPSDASELPLASRGLTVRDGLRWATRRLTISGCDSPRLDAELLLSHVLQRDRSGMPVIWESPLAVPDIEHLSNLVNRRAAREPLSYILGWRGFYDITLRVTPAVLTPRPETEHLVEHALAWALEQPPPLRVLDVGTGSGAIALVLARHLPDAEVWAVDISPAALAIARENARAFSLSNRIRLLESNLLEAVGGSFDLIAANLPYIPGGEIDGLMPEVSQHEPRLALDGGADGLDLVRALVAQLPARLNRPGLALLEIDCRQGSTVTDLARAVLPEAQTTILQDYAGLDRVVVIERLAAQ